MLSTKHKLIVLSPAKAGSTSLYKCMEDTGIEFDVPKKITHYPKIHLTLSEICDVYKLNKEELIDYKIVQLVRNPIDRFKSAFYHHQRLTSKELKLLPFIIQLNALKKLLPNNSGEFYDSFYQNNHQYNSFQMGNWGGIRFWYEQNWYNDMGADVKYFKLETINQKLSEFSEYLELDIKEFPYEYANPKEGMEFDNDNVRSLISQMYAKDINLFGYGQVEL